MAKIGIERCKDFDLMALDPAAQEALEDLPKEALDKIAAKKDSVAT